MESSGEETTRLPEQVIMEEILPRLPVKSLFKFRFILWNPATKKFKNLPDFNNGMMSRGFILKYGFGFDELNDDYKVFGLIILVSETGNYSSIAKVYSLRSNSWKDVELTDISPVDDVGIYVSGNLHWNSFEDDILSFNLNTHLFGVIELPSYTNGDFRSVGTVWGCLSAHFRLPNGDLDVWLMKEYGVKESWVKVATLSFDTDPITCELSTPLVIAPNGEVLLGYDSTMMIYNPNSSVIRHPHITGLMGIYIESLVSLES